MSAFDFNSALSAATPPPSGGVLGGFGRWQRRNFLLLSLVVAESGLAVVTWTFAAFQVQREKGTL